MCEVLRRACFSIPVLCFLIGVFSSTKQTYDEQSTVDESNFAPLGMLEPLHSRN